MCGILELLGLCGILELLGLCGILELLGLCGTLEMLGLCGILELLGLCGIFSTLLLAHDYFLLVYFPSFYKYGGLFDILIRQSAPTFQVDSIFHWYRRIVRCITSIRVLFL